MSYKKISIVVVAMCVTVSSVMAQLNDISRIVKRIAKTYDSTASISLDVKYSYTEKDIINKDSASEELSGSLTIAPKKSFYKLSNMEFIKNDSFFLAVNDEKKFIMVANPQDQNGVASISMLTQVDSMLNYYSQQYIIHLINAGKKGIIDFRAKDSSARYKVFTLTYDRENYTIESLKYIFETKGVIPVYDDGKMNPDDPLPPKPFLKLITFNISFYNYKTAQVSSTLFDQRNYVVKEGKKFVPTEKYKGYVVYNSWQQL